MRRGSYTWRVILLDAFSVLFEYDNLTEEYLPMYDYAGLAALALFLGGIMFWFLVLLAVVVGVARGIKRVYDSGRDLLGRGGSSLPHIER